MKTQIIIAGLAGIAGKSTPAQKIGMLLLASIIIPTSLQATVIARYDFTSDTEFFEPTNATGLTSTSGLLTGTATTGDPRLTRTFTDPEALVLPAGETWATVTFRVREKTPASDVVTPFSDSGVLVALNDIAGTSMLSVFSGASLTAVDSSNGFFTVTADISSYAGDDIQFIRLDPIGGNSSNSTFEVDFIEISSVPEPSSLALLGLGGLAVMLRRRK